MEKTARRPSADPTQERLRQNKSTWNKEVSTFINDLIHFKKMMNGWPSKFFKERARITQPIPADPATIIGSLAGDFQEIASKGTGIIQEQLEYSKTRRQKQPKPPAPAGAPAAPEVPSAPPAPSAGGAPDLAEQMGKKLAASDQASEYYLVSEASNPLTRFFHRLLSPGLGLSSEAARVRKYRGSLMNAALQVFKDLKKVQSAIVDSGPQSIFVASQLLNKVEDNYVFLASGTQAFKETMPQGVADAGGNIALPTEETSKSPGVSSPSAGGELLNDPKVAQAIQVVQDIQVYSNNFKGVSGLPALRGVAAKFAKGTPQEKIQLADILISMHQQAVSQVCASKQIPSQQSFADIVAFEAAKVATQSQTTAEADDQIQVVAQNMLGKWRHHLSPFDKTSAFRLDIYKLGRESRKLIDKIMDHLQSDLDPAILYPMVKELGNNLMKMKTLMHGLSSTIRGMGYQPQFMNMLERGHVGNYDVNLNPKQRTELEKLLQQKQLRDISKMYNRK
jgi:hypothetical protein